MVLSAQFWPSFREEKVTLPEEMQKLLEEYTKKFEAQKGNRTLNWKSHLGTFFLFLKEDAIDISPNFFQKGVTLTNKTGSSFSGSLASIGLLL